LEGFQKKGRDHAGAEAATHGGSGYFVSYLYGHFMILMLNHFTMNMQSVESLYHEYAVIFDIPVMTLSGHVTSWTLAIIVMDTSHQHGTIYQHNTTCRTLAAAASLISNSTIFDWKVGAGSGPP
jgi:hypothetical protein